VGKVADTHNGPSTPKCLHRWRTVIVALVAVVVASWGGRMAEPLARGWYNSCQVLDTRAEIDALDKQRQDLEEDLDYARSDEGMDVEARRQFGVSPPDDVRIVVRVKSGEGERRQPVSLGDRVRGAVSRVGGACAAAVRHTRDVIKYWWGLDPVGPVGNAPTEDEPPGEAEPSEATG